MSMTNPPSQSPYMTEARAAGQLASGYPEIPRGRQAADSAEATEPTEPPAASVVAVLGYN